MSHNEIEKIYLIVLDFIERKGWCVELQAQICNNKKNELLRHQDSHILSFIINWIKRDCFAVHETVINSLEGQYDKPLLEESVQRETLKIKKAILEACDKAYYKSAVTLFLIFEVSLYLSVKRALDKTISVKSEKVTHLIYQMH